MSSFQVPQTGSTFADRYRVEGLLGEGGMGVVLRATQLPNGRPVALKVLTADAAALGETVARFRQEAQIASRIRNVHVVSVLDFGEAADGRQFIAMELLEGIDLASLVELRGALPTEEAVALVLQGCAGVAAAHAQGLIHRDLKPANLFLARREGLPPVVKVLDFGLSKSLDTKAVQLTQTATAMGTPMYMAPEQIISVKHVDARCDQHALGMVLFELLTGHPPYEFPTAIALAVAIATHPPPSARAYRPELPVKLDEAVQRALAKRPEDRFADLGQLAQAIVAFAPPGGSAFAQMVEATLAPLREPENEAAPTVQMSLPDWLLVAKSTSRSGRSRKLVVPGTAATPPAMTAPPEGASSVPITSAERASVVVTASPVSTDPRARVLARDGRRQTGLLLGGVAVGIALVAAITFALVSPSATEVAPQLAVSAPDVRAPDVPTTAPGPTIEPSAPAGPSDSAPPQVSAAPATSASALPTAEPSARAPRRPGKPGRKPGKQTDPLLKYD